jgi:hypothetical protein
VCEFQNGVSYLFERENLILDFLGRARMAAPRTSTAAGKGVAMVPASPKRPRDDEDEEVSRTNQTQTMEPRGSIMNIDIHCCGLNETAQRTRGASPLYLSHTQTSKLS